MLSNWLAPDVHYPLHGGRSHMAVSPLSIPKRIYKTLANLRTGIVLLILVVIASALGTFILQRPVTDADKLARTYSPEALRWLDRLGLDRRFPRLVVHDAADAGQPQHRLRFRRSLSQRVALLRAALSQDRFALSLGASQQGRVADPQCRSKD